MILVVGSMASGKRSFLRSLGYDDASMADAVIDGAPVVFNVQDLVRTRLEEGADAAAVSSEYGAAGHKPTSDALLLY